MRIPNLTPCLVAAIFCGACGGSDQPDSLTAVDVVEQPALDPTNDPVASARPTALIGILPSDFPDDVTLYLPASLVDFETSEEIHWVDLFTPSPVSTVRPELIALLRSSGWSVNDSTPDTLTASKDSRRLQISIRDARPGTEYRIEYSG